MSGQSIDSERIRELADREAIRELLHRYCFAIDRGTGADVMALFAPECELEVVPGDTHRGRAAVAKWYDSLTRKRMQVLRHQAHNQIIDIDGDRAFAQAYWDVTGDLNGESMVSAGFYEDSVQRCADGWKFVKKRILIDYMGPLRDGWAGPRRIRSRLLGELRDGIDGWR